MFVSCVNKDLSTGSVDWAFNFIHWKGTSYSVTEEKVPQSKIEEKLGEVQKYSDDENFSSRYTYSNIYPVGTEFYKIKSISKNDAIAVKTNEDFFKLVKTK